MLSLKEAFKASGSVQSIGVLKKQLWQVQQIRKEVERKDVVLAEMKLQVEELRKYEQQVDNLKQQLNIYQNNIKVGIFARTRYVSFFPSHLF